MDNCFHVMVCRGIVGNTFPKHFLVQASALADTELTDAPNGVFRARKNEKNEGTGGKWRKMGENGGKWGGMEGKWSKMEKNGQKWGIHEHI